MHNFIDTTLKKVFYSPCTLTGALYKPEDIWTLPQTHRFNFPRCFHGTTSRPFKIMGLGLNLDKFVAACGHGFTAGGCPFLGEYFFPFATLTIFKLLSSFFYRYFRTRAAN